MTTNDRNIALIAKAQAGDLAARNECIEVNLPLIRKAISKACGNRGDQRDHFAVATVAMIRAIDKFNPALGFYFSTYAVTSMVRAVRASIVEGRVISPKRFANLAKCPKVVSAEPANAELSQLFDRTARKWRDCGRADAKLDALAVFRRFTATERALVASWLRDETLESMGKRHGFSKERARQIIERAFRRIRESEANNDAE